MKKILLILLSVSLLITMAGCEESSSTDSKQEAKTEQIMQEMNNQVGMPDITNFTEKKLAKDIFELRDDADLITYTYTQNLEGKYVYLGQSIGYGLPYSVQYTNPERIADYSSGGGYIVLPQADPNGLFMPEGLSATWITMIDKNTGERHVAYMEQELSIFTYKLARELTDESSLPSDY